MFLSAGAATAVALAFGGLIGSYFKAWVSQDQATWSRKSIVDVLLGGVVGVLYPLYPIIPLPESANLLQQAALVGVISYFSADTITNVLGKLGVKLPTEGAPKAEVKP